jgi:proline racemase
MNISHLYTTIDTHTGGEPLRIVTGGIPPVKGDTMLERTAFFREQLDRIRNVLMHEPRGHQGMHGCVIVPPVSPDAHLGILFMDSEGYGTMCGHEIIAVVTAMIETGYVQVTEETAQIVIDSPAGKVIAGARVAGTEVKSVSFEHVPSYVCAQNVRLTIDGRSFTVDIAFGGAFYAVADAKDLGVHVEIDQLAALQKWGQAICEQLEANMRVQHPVETQLQGVHGVIISDAPQSNGAHLRSVTILANGQIVRSPCGASTAARLASLYQLRQVHIGEAFVHEGIVGSQCTGIVTGTTKVREWEAVVPRIEGRAFVTGLHQFVVDPEDPLADGFLLG